MPSALTRNILVEVVTEYVLERSDPQQPLHFFAYHIKITNRGQETVQLLSRHWIITNSHGHIEEVAGLGVVGEQPVLEPGTSFEYTSACPLKTPTGSMQGTYQMLMENGESFDIEIPFFELKPAYTLH